MISLYLLCYLDLSFFPFAKVWYLYTTLCYFNLSFFPFAKVWYLFTTLLLFGSLFFPLCKSMISWYRSHVIWNPLFSLCKSMISIQLLFFDSLKKISFDKYGIYEQPFFLILTIFFHCKSMISIQLELFYCSLFFLGGHFPEHIIPLLTI